MFPDLTFIEEERDNLLAIIITHAHEDHIGALAELWPRLRAPVYATRFAVGRARGSPSRRARRAEGRADARSRPASASRSARSRSNTCRSRIRSRNSNALAIRTPLGLVLHTGDWKLDDTPFVGNTTSEAVFRALGDEGILALVCDSTNVVRDGRSPSESDVAKRLAEIIKASPHRVAVTTFASNVARIRAVALAAQACGREVRRGRARHGPHHRGRARMRLSRRAAGVPSARGLWLPAARQGRRPDHGIAGRAPRRARPHRR